VPPRRAGILAEHEEAMRRGIAARAGEPWFDDACEALEREEAGDYESDEELAGLAAREFPFYFAVWDDGAGAYLETIRDELPTSDALKLFNDEIMRTFDLRPELGMIAAPTLVITGEEDFITEPVAATELGEGIVGAETVILPRIGHFVFVEGREAFREAVWRFLGVAP
jgi:pimeloyl-ACP methyl ester carboxylesterase